MTQEAMKLALEALEADELDMVDDGSGNMVFRKEQAITAIKEALRENAMREVQRLGQEIEQEPVAWVCESSSSDEKHGIDYWPGDVDDLPIGTQLYAAPPAQQWNAGVPPLYPKPEPGVSIKAEYEPAQPMHPEIKKMYEDYFDKCFRGASPTQQAPVAWGVFEGNLHDMFFTEAEAVQMADLKGTHAEVRPLYTAPPQRTQPNDIDLFWRAATTPEKWVGLTDEEIWETISRIGTSDSDVNPYAKLSDARAIEAKLKEKNNAA